MKLKIVNVELFEDDDDDNDLNDLTKYILYVHTLLYDHICHPQYVMISVVVLGRT